jgi:hypothetical protein
MDYFSTQGWVYIIISIIATLVAFALNLYLQGPGFYLLGYFIYLLIILLTAYNITCLTTGECYVWSWIVTILSTLPMLFIIGLVIFIIATGKGNKV